MEVAHPISLVWLKGNDQLKRRNTSSEGNLKVIIKAIMEIN